MTGGHRLAAVAAVGVVAAAGGVGLGAVDAASSVVSGWWTSAPVAVAPDVADNQLLVQGGSDPSQPVAYAGISFALAPDELPQKLALSVAPNSATTPGAKLALCRLGAPASPAKGDAASGGPPFDCATKVEAAPSSNGATYEFAVGTLAKGGALDVAVLPTQPTDRVVLTKPAVAALQSASGPSTSSSPTGASDRGGVSGGGVAASPDVGGAAAPVDLGATAASSGPIASSAPGPAATAATGTNGANPNVRLTAPAVSQRAGGSSRSLAPFAFGGMAVAALALWALAGQRSPEAAGESGESTDTGEFG